MLPYATQTVDERDERALLDVLASGWLTTGPAVRRFEEAVATRVGARHAVAFSSGTAALHAAAAAAGLGEGDEVVTTPLSFVATANSVLYQGARPVFADVERETLLLDVERTAAAVTSATRALLPVDFTGQPCDIRALRELATSHGLLLIEDAAHSLGATFDGRPVGSLADMTCFSFHPVKHVAAGEGGMVTTDDEQLAARLVRFRNHGISASFRERASRGTWEYDVEAVGFNYRLSDLHSALGASQLARLDASIERRRAIVARYQEGFASLDAVERPTTRPGRESSWHLYTIRLRLDRLGVGRQQVFDALRAENIGVNVHYIPIPRHSLYRQLGYRPEACPVAEAEYERLVTLPLFPAMTDDDVDDVLEAVRKVVTAYGV